jgi:hypothetical protein
LTRQEGAECQAANRHSLELMHLVAKLRKHTANLAILSLIENHLQDGALLVMASDRDPLRVDLALRQPDALPKTIEQFRGRHTGNLHEVFLLDAIPGMRQEVGELTVIGEQDEPFAHAIETPHRKQPAVTRHEINHPRPSGRVVIRRHHADRFVKEKDDPLGVWQPLTVHANFLVLRIDLRAEEGHDLAVDLDTTRRHQLLAGPPTPKPCRRENLLKPLDAVAS